MKNLLFLLALLAFSFALAYIYGRKRLVEMKRSPKILLWFGTEEVLASGASYVLVDAYTSGSAYRALSVVGAGLLGGLLGLSASGLILWRSK